MFVDVVLQGIEGGTVLHPYWQVVPPGTKLTEQCQCKAACTSSLPGRCAVSHQFHRYLQSRIGDSDNDGLSDGDEVYTYGTDPNDADSDDDGLDEDYKEEKKIAFKFFLPFFTI